jgi:hypothetical protein
VNLSANLESEFPHRFLVEGPAGDQQKMWPEIFWEAFSDMRIRLVRKLGQKRSAKTLVGIAVAEVKDDSTK